MIVLTEQSFRNFRHYYRSLKNGNHRLGHTGIAGAALYWLCANNPNHTYKDGDYQLGQLYLMNGPRCDGDVLRIGSED